MERVRIIFANDRFIAVSKPANLLSVPGRGEEKADCAITQTQQIFPDALTVHRLDMATSGLLLMARGKPMQRALSMMFAAGDVDKVYIAEVWGQPAPKAGLIDLPLSADWPRRPRQKVDPLNGKPSRTAYETLSHTSGATRLRLKPLTGRSHQLRVHLAAIGHPILGDDFYAAEPARMARPRLTLHAERLTFRDPLSGETVALVDPCPF